MNSVCRSCLSVKTPLSQMDDNFRSDYFLLTNIQVKPMDGLPQDRCMKCAEIVASFIQFREKCLQSESCLQQGLENKTIVKVENDIEIFQENQNINEDFTYSAEEESDNCANVEVKVEKDEIIGRPAEIAESDVFVCESLNDEFNRVARKLKSELRRFEHTKDVTVDEDVKPQFTNSSNTTIDSQDVEMFENSLDESNLASPATPLSIGGNSNLYNPSMSAMSSSDRPSSIKRRELGQTIVTGYILYAREIRKAIIANNPGSTFGEISRIVGNEWRSLTISMKQLWKERADRCNEETSARIAVERRKHEQSARDHDASQKLETQ